MPALTPDDRRTVRSRIARSASADGRTVGILKADVRTAVDAADQWLADNEAAFLRSIPEPAASAMTDAEKMDILHAVMHRRMELI